MTDNPLVSIVITCYNYSQYIERCIQSAIDQTYRNIEVIVVDNGSTDNSLEKIKTFLCNPRVVIIELKKNIPPGVGKESAFGVAIQRSSGRYVSVLYADDWYLPTKIEKQVSLFSKSSNSVGVIYCHGYRYLEQSGRMSKWKHQSVRGYVFRSYLLNGDVVIPISPLVKRHCYDIVGLNNIWTGSEYDFLVMSQYVDFDFVDEYLVVMRDHNNNDAKNIYSVYKRLTQFHKTALLEGNARSREGRLVNMRVAHDAFSDGLTFITMLDKCHGKEAIFYAVKVYPLIILRWKLVMAIILIYLPLPILKYLLNKSGKKSLFKHVECEW